MDKASRYLRSSEIKSSSYQIIGALSNTNTDSSPRVSHDSSEDKKIYSEKNSKFNLDAIKIKNIIDDLNKTSGINHRKAEHFQKIAISLQEAYEELHQLSKEYESRLSKNIDGEDCSDDAEKKAQYQEKRIQNLIDFIQSAISDISNFFTSENNTQWINKNNTNESESNFQPVYPSHTIQREEIDTSSEVSYESSDESDNDDESQFLFKKYINDNVISESTKFHQTKLEMHTRVEQDHAKENIFKKYFYNGIAGAVSYLTAFGVGNLAARVTPGISSFMLPILAAPLHTFVAGPLSGMIRSTTWVNPATKEQITHQRAHARAQGDKHRKAAGLESKVKFIWQGKRLTAKEILQKDPYFMNWHSKVLTDDVPFFSFLGFYLLRNLSIELLRPTLDQPDFSFVPTAPGYHADDFFSTHTWAGFGADLGLQTLAGTLSGALTMIISQAIRACVTEFHCIEHVTKTAAIWNLERIYLASCKADFETAIKNSTDNGITLLLNAELEKIQIQLNKAEKKSSLLSSYWYEVDLLWQEKKKGIAGDPDQPGTRLDTLCDIAGKFISLLPVAITSQIINAYAPVHASTYNAAWFQMYARALTPPLALMFFLQRSELSGYVRLIYGDIKGRNSASKIHDTVTGIPGIIATRASPISTRSQPNQGDDSEDESIVIQSSYDDRVSDASSIDSSSLV